MDRYKNEVKITKFFAIPKLVGIAPYTVKRERYPIVFLKINPIRPVSPMGLFIYNQSSDTPF